MGASGRGGMPIAGAAGVRAGAPGVALDGEPVKRTGAEAGRSVGGVVVLCAARAVPLVSAATRLGPAGRTE